MIRLWRSLSFRLALGYAALFTISVSLLMALYYWASIHRPLEEVRDGLRDENGTLVEIYRTGGVARLTPLLEQRAAATGVRRPYHALVDARGAVVTTNLPSWPQSGSGPAWSEPSGQRWIRIEADIYRDGDEDDHEALVLDQRLNDGGRLMLGRDINDIDDIEEAVVDTAVWLPPIILLLGLLGGALMSRAIGQRLDAMTVTARRVMDGDLAERVPLRGGNDDFDRLGATLNAMLDRIEASLDAVRRVSESVAHELRTPLSRLRADLAELAAASPADAALLIARAESESERLSRMFDAVLRISRIEARRHAAELRPVELGEVGEDVADYHAPQAEERALVFRTEIEPGITVLGDRDLLFQAISNLIDNAVKFTPRGGEVTLSIKPVDEDVLLSVTDSGPGLPHELLEKAGQRFFRAPAAADTQGFGLGLALVRAVATLHESQFTLANAELGLRAEWRLRRMSS